MKKQNLFLVIAMAFIVISFTACNSKTQDSTEMQTPTEIVANTDATTNLETDSSSLKTTKDKDEKDVKDEKDEKDKKNKKDKD